MSARLHELLARQSALLAELAAVSAELSKVAAVEPEPTGNGTEERLLTPDEAAAFLRVTKREVYSLARTVEWRSFIVVKISRKRMRIREAAFHRWLNQNSRSEQRRSLVRASNG